MKKDIKLIVAAIIRDNHRKILAVRRKSDDVHGGGWEFPGGKIEHAEQPEEALEREIQEELGVGIDIERIFDAVMHEYENFKVFIVFYLCNLKSGAPLSLNAHDRFLWLAPSQLDEVDFLPADAGTVKKLMEAEENEFKR